MRWSEWFALLDAIEATEQRLATCRACREAHPSVDDELPEPKQPRLARVRRPEAEPGDRTEA
jgi:hypothetical protein